MIEDHETAKAAGFFFGLEKAVDHGQPVRQAVGQRRADKPIFAGFGIVRPIFHDDRVDGGFFHHGGVVEHRHVSHAAIAMARVKISAQQRDLFPGGVRAANAPGNIGIAREGAPARARQLEIIDDNAHRHASVAGFAGGQVNQVLRPAKSAPGQERICGGSAFAGEIGKNFSFALAFEIGAWRRGRDVKLTAFKAEPSRKIFVSHNLQRKAKTLAGH